MAGDEIRWKFLGFSSVLISIYVAHNALASCVGSLKPPKVHQQQGLEFKSRHGVINLPRKHMSAIDAGMHLLIDADSGMHGSILAETLVIGYDVVIIFRICNHMVGSRHFSLE